MRAEELGMRRGLGKVWAAVAVAVMAMGLSASQSDAAVLLNDTFADGNRTSTSLPTDSPVYIGQTSGNGSNAVSAGSIDFIVPTNSLKMWTYYTSDNSAPDGNQPHNSVTQLAPGEQLKAQMTFTLPLGASAASTSKNFRMGLFWDPTDARVQTDANSDGGGAAAPWTDALGYNVQIPLNSTSSGTNPFQIGKRTTSNSSLIGSGSAYTFAPTGGTQYALAANTPYTLELLLNVISSSQLDVTATLSEGATVLSSHTVSDLGATFGGTAVAGLLPGATSIYTNFDQLMFRNSDATQFVTNGTAPGDTVNLKINNLYVEQIPEPSSLALLGVGALALLRRRGR
jgi:hypothetical protein